jgi:hypothetical protein
MRGEMTIVTPIKRKGCKNAGWVWNERTARREVVAMNPYERVVIDGVTLIYPPPQGWSYSMEENYFVELKRKPQEPKKWWMVWRRK